jgi:hypothetical protein
LIRLHRIDENDASQVAPLLSFLRQLQRRYQLKLPLPPGPPLSQLPLSPPRDPQGNGNGKHPSGP